MEDTEINTDFLLEKTLASKSPDLLNNFKNVVFVMNNILNKTTSLFPDFTDHTIRHSIIVMEMANKIIGADQIAKLNADEIYILMCAVYMHDFGMTISKKDFFEMKDGIVPLDFGEDNQVKAVKDAMRRYHHLFSEKLILKYADIFEFPSQEHTFCISKVAKGHRKTDLFDENEYCPMYKLPNGNTVHLPYLASIIRLCDEMDVTIERNTAISYLEHADTLSYKEHFAIKQLVIGKDRFVIRVETGEEEIKKSCSEIINKLNDTLQYCINVTASKTDFEIRQRSVEIFTKDLSKRTAVILDSDIGTDDAMALSLIKNMGDFKPNFIIATPGNASRSQVVVNAIILKKMFGIDAVIVQGEAPEDIAKMAEKNTFHGKDGLAGISGQLVDKCNLSETELADYISMEELKKMLEDYDSIIYIAICPLNSFCSLYNDTKLKDKFSRLYIMGGGINEFNCSHLTEFNFSKAPIAVKQVLSSGLDITLFPLDLTNSQYLTADEIDKLAADGANADCITFLKHNLSANESYNKISGAVLHDTMPILYLCAPHKFEIEEKRLLSDEFGAIREDSDGAAVTIAVSVEDGFMKQSISEAIRNLQ